MREMFQSKILVGFMLFFVGCMSFTNPDNSNSDNLVLDDSNEIIVSEYAYI